MFILHSSNKTENLLAHLSAVISNAPLSSPFEKEVFLIQSQGMERWLSQALASELNVFANYAFFFPGKFFSTLAASIDSDLSDHKFERHTMLWRIEALLRKLDGDDLAPLRQYLSGDTIALKRYQLAQQLSQIFDQYQMMRPEMLEAWQDNKMLYQSAAERWQKALWLKITQQTGSRHRGVLWLEVINKLNKAEPGTYSHKLPGRICVFGLNTLPPLFLCYLEGLSKHCDVHFFLLNPSQEFWADLDRKRLLLAEAEADDAFQGHPLLASLGQQGREFQAMLLEQQVEFTLELDSFEDVSSANNLQQLQNDMLSNSLSGQILKKDESIRIHACHTQMREVEVLKNELLNCLEQDPTLALRDIVVMAPDIETYEPFISAVFHDIQHAIADRSLRLSNDVLDAFIRFLTVSQSRFGWQTVLDLLEQPVVSVNFGLTETDLDLIKHWLQETEVRWGKSAAHKKELGLPELDQNTWQAALDRLLIGYAVQGDNEFVCDILPYSAIEGSSAQALGGLCEFMELLFKASKALKQPKTLKHWSEQLYFYADALMRDADTTLRQQLNELIAELSEDMSGVHNEPVELQVIVSWLEGMVKERKSSHGFLRGQLTFCSMLPMRSIPFKVIALLGMNEGEFPNCAANPTFDLLSQNFRKGDRSRRKDDRYQFLEILLSTRNTLIMTYLGQSLSTNEAIAPSVVISELLTVLKEYYQLDDLIIKQPLQAFSPRYFDASCDLFSFSKTDCETAMALSSPKPPDSLWWQGTSSAESSEVIEISDLFKFFRHPQKYFIQSQLGLRFNGIEAQTEEREPFAINKLEGYGIYQQWIENTLNDETFSLKKLQAQGHWLSGALGELEFAQQEPNIHEFADNIKTKDLGARLDDRVIDISVAMPEATSIRLIGKLSNRHENASLFYRYADLKGRDFIAALLHHLIMNQVAEHSTYLLSKDEDLQFPPELCHESQLAAFLVLYQQGQQSPDAFFVDPALSYVKQAYKLKQGSRASKPALDAAREQLTLAMERGYEPELSKLYGQLEDPGEVLNEVFERLCKNLLQPFWDATH